MGTHVLQDIVLLRPDGAGAPQQPHLGLLGGSLNGAGPHGCSVIPSGGKHDECAWLLADVLSEVRVLDHPETRCTPAACVDRAAGEFVSWGPRSAWLKWGRCRGWIAVLVGLAPGPGSALS